MMTLHPVESSAKVDALVASLEAHGWQGAPLVTMGEQLITGTHRYYATQALGWANYEIPTIELEEVFAEAGIDFFSVWKSEGQPSPLDYGFGYVLDALPSHIREKHGIESR